MYAIRSYYAGLECGVIGAKYPGMDMISVGPTIKHPHSPDEMMEIETVKNIWDLLVEYLANQHLIAITFFIFLLFATILYLVKSLPLEFFILTIKLKCVITSYSIHYTKLYDSSPVELGGGSYTIGTLYAGTVYLDVTFDSTINKTGNLTLNSGIGYADFNGVIGGVEPVTSLTINNANRIDMSGVGVATTGVTGNIILVTPTTNGVILV